MPRLPVPVRAGLGRASAAVVIYRNQTSAAPRCPDWGLVKNETWSGPLGWDELALIPVESYHL